MAFKLADAFIELSAKDQKLNASLKRVDKNLEKVRKQTISVGNSLASAFGITLGAGVAVQGIRAIINAQAEQEQAEAKLEAVIKATGGAAGLTAEQIKRYASELQDVTRFGDEATISAAALLGTFRNIQGPVFKDTIRLAQDMATVMGQDLNSAILQLGKALNDPITNLTNLQRVGITFSEQQKEMIKGFVESNELAKAQAVILDELTNQFGGAAQADAKTFAGAIDQLKNAIGDLGEAAARSGLIQFLEKAARVAKQFVDQIERLSQVEDTVLEFFKVSIGVSAPKGLAGTFALRGPQGVLSEIFNRNFIQGAGGRTAKATGVVTDPDQRKRDQAQEDIRRAIVGEGGSLASQIADKVDTTPRFQ